MRALNRNKQCVYYSLLGEPETVYERDEDGNIIYDTMPDGVETPRIAGEDIQEYQEPVKVYGNIAASGGVAETESYGVDLSDYDAILYLPKGTVPLDETTLIWYQTDLTYKDGKIDATTADYKVARVPPVLNEMVYLLKGLS